MGINIFVEGHSLPVVVSIKLPRSVDNLSMLKEIVDSLKYINDYEKRQWGRLQKIHYKYTTKLVSFKIGSEPELKIFCNPSWIAVFIMVIANYKNIKNNIQELQNDIEKLCNYVAGMTTYEISLLKIAIELNIKGIQEKGEKAEKLIKKFGVLRKKVLGNEYDKYPEIKVNKLEDNK
jgi:hypothetical protein